MTKSTSSCPCGSQRPLTDCCQPIHCDPSLAIHPEQLMRSRYSAHVLGLVDYVIATYHPSCEAEQHRDAIADSVHSQWLELDIVNSEIVDSGEGYVEFNAYYREGKNDYCLHERSRFVQEEVNGKQQWFYIDGEYPESTNSASESTPSTNEKVGRNDPCPCGSGKKHKKCCG
ncbi:YchJ family metal-binding protein [Photobacterium nomapromontoriensis]|uniref:YchJ family metal-binding protein n=1 Tax=Photobacterium nomapromontoriensis TaxID=2910237 RepID=UPI003D0CDD20